MAYVYAALFALVFVLAAFLAARFLGPLVARAARRFNHPCIAQAAEAFLRPSAYSLIALGIYGGVSLLPAEVRERLAFLSATGTACAVACICFCAWGLVRAARVAPQLILGVGEKLELGTGRALANFLTRILQGIILLIAAAMVLDKLGQNINGVLTGLGLGGLSFALAGQDLISNFFGGIILITERPFEIGDWVATPDAEGTVEDITLRCTKIRTLDNALVTVPNQKFTAGAITNWSKLTARLVQFTLNLDYATPPDAVRAVSAELRRVLAAERGVQGDTVQVRMTDISAEGLTLFLQFYLDTADLADARARREGLNLRVLDVLAAHQVRLAYPGREVRIHDVERNLK